MGAATDSGTTIDLESSSPDRIVLRTSFHHMDENGYYDGWSNHTIIVTPSLAFGFNLRITGRDRNQIKDYLADLFYSDLSSEISETHDRETDRSSFALVTRP